MSKYLFPLIDDDGNEYDDLLYKRCGRCRTIKPHVEFYRDLQRHDNLQPQCKLCENKYHREWRRNPKHLEKDRQRSRNRYNDPDKRAQDSSRKKEKYKKDNIEMDNIEMDKQLHRMMRTRLAPGHYICLCSPEGGDDKFGACINSGRVPALRSYVTRFYYDRNPCEAIKIAVDAHNEMWENKTKEDTTS